MFYRRIWKALFSSCDPERELHTSMCHDMPYGVTGTAYFRGGSRGKELPMEYKLVIFGRLDGLNDYTAANRTNPHKGGKMKKDNEETVIWAIRQQLRRLHIESPCSLNSHGMSQISGRTMTMCQALAGR